MHEQHLNTESPVTTSKSTNGPVEIDASLLVQIGGGTPKGTWTEPEVALASTDPNLTPKGTW